MGFREMLDLQAENTEENDNGMEDIKDISDAKSKAEDYCYHSGPADQY